MRALRYRRPAPGHTGWRCIAGGAMRNRRSAVLGGSGFIGRYVVKRLAERGDVVAVGRAQRRRRQIPEAEGRCRPGRGLINIAIDDEKLLPSFIAGNQAVVNCVGILGERPQGFDRVHPRTARLARLARGRGWRDRCTFRRSAPIGVRPRLCAHQGPGRPPCATRFRRQRAAALHRVRAGGPVLQPVRRWRRFSRCCR